jgi:hypothetical protein
MMVLMVNLLEQLTGTSSPEWHEANRACAEGGCRPNKPDGIGGIGERHCNFRKHSQELVLQQGPDRLAATVHCSAGNDIEDGLHQV